MKALTLKTGETVKDTGIWFDSSGILGTSPRGIVDDETVLKTKSPNTERNLTTEKAVNSTSFCLALKKDPVYWHQVQGQMYFSHRTFTLTLIIIIMIIIIVIIITTSLVVHPRGGALTTVYFCTKLRLKFKKDIYNK